MGGMGGMAGTAGMAFFVLPLDMQSDFAFARRDAM